MSRPPGMIQTLIYDGSFTGCLSALFEVYEYKFGDLDIQPESSGQSSIFGEVHRVHTDPAKAARVWQGLKRRISPQSVNAFYRSYLSEEKGIENKLLAYLRHILDGRPGAEHDYSNPAVNYIVATAKKVYREKHRMEAFVRFQRQADGLYIATIDPDFHVLPLIQSHFERRYADQRWIIFDTRRRQGIYYNLRVTMPVMLEEMAEPSAGQVADRDGMAECSVGAIADCDGMAECSVGLLADCDECGRSSKPPVNPGENQQTSRPLIELDEKEEMYQRLWQQYFASVNIAARRNMKLHVRHMPMRYWKYLPEKQPVFNAACRNPGTG